MQLTSFSARLAVSSIDRDLAPIEELVFTEDAPKGRSADWIPIHLGIFVVLRGSGFSRRFLVGDSSVSVASSSEGSPESSLPARTAPDSVLVQACLYVTPIYLQALIAVVLESSFDRADLARLVQGLCSAALVSASITERSANHKQAHPIESITDTSIT